MLILQNISYTHLNKELLFSNISLVLNKRQKVALIGNNGVGKSTLLKIISGELKFSDGQLIADPKSYYIPQLYGQYDHLSIARALKIDVKIKALKEILNGRATDENLNLLNNDWSIEERCIEALNYWQLPVLDPDQKMGSLSGGQKTKVFLAGIQIHQPKFLLFDEPSNHLDLSGRKLLYDFIRSTSASAIVVSHDRKLLDLLDTICELDKRGIKTYSGNYSFYEAQKRSEAHSLNMDLKNKEKALRKAKEKERDTLERQQKLDARGKKKQEKAGVARIMMNTLKNNAEKSTAKIKDVHIEKINGIFNELDELRKELPDLDKIKLGFNDTGLHKGKILFNAIEINFNYETKKLWNEDLNLQILSGDRLALKGSNGSGKTTLINMLLGKLEPKKGIIHRTENRSMYVDQEYSIISDRLTVYDQAQSFNNSALQEHEIKTRLNRFLFTKEHWNKSCGVLSGGEKMRLMLCCLTIASTAPDIIVLDEPTNNLDLQNVQILTAAINEYQGTLLVVSHDEYFLEQIRIEKVINL